MTLISSAPSQNTTTRWLSRLSRKAYRPDISITRIVSLPPVQKSGAVEYLSGGIGLDESTAIKSASRQGPLSLVFSVQAAGKAEFASDVKLTIRDAKGAPVLETTASGPFLLAKLPPGSYSLRATLAGKLLERKVQVKAGSSVRVELVWPAGTNQGRP